MFDFQSRTGAEHERPERDNQWTRIVDLEIVPHPRLQHPQTIAVEYAMRDGCLHTEVRAALAGYTLRRWNVDGSADHHLDGPEIHLWLRKGLHTTSMRPFARLAGRAPRRPEIGS